jgi:hypothetical protein
VTIAPRGRIKLGQANGPEVELYVDGDEWYATYHTPDGHAVVYDPGRGLFCHARLVNGRFESTGVPSTDPAPADAAPPHSEESPAVREARTAESQARRAPRAKKESP